VKDVAFTVTDVRSVYEKAVARGAISVSAPHEETDKDGTVILATIATVSGT
jgi:4-hydroxyphenylpyruvate dioxygenase